MTRHSFLLNSDTHQHQRRTNTHTLFCNTVIEKGMEGNVFREVECGGGAQAHTAALPPQTREGSDERQGSSLRENTDVKCGQDGECVCLSRCTICVFCSLDLVNLVCVWKPESEAEGRRVHLCVCEQLNCSSGVWVATAAVPKTTALLWF